MLKKIIIFLLVLILLISASLFVYYYLEMQKGGSWVCLNSQWVKQGNPKEAAPTEPCVQGPPDVVPPKSKLSASDLKVTFPLPGDKVYSPLTLKGEARGPWYFEASFPVKLLDDKGQTLIQGVAQAKGDWMTEKFVPFEAVLEFAKPAGEIAGTLVLENDNPSGLPENSIKVEIPVTITESEGMKINVYFSNDKMNPEMLDCSLVFPIEKTVPKTLETGKASLNEMLKGLTEEEKEAGYFTSINEGVVLESLVIDKGIATAKFNDVLEKGVGGSCKVTAIRSQITQTLKQFPTVNEVVIMIGDRVEDVLQP